MSKKIPSMYFTTQGPNLGMFHTHVCIPGRILLSHKQYYSMWVHVQKMMNVFMQKVYEDDVL